VTVYEKWDCNKPAPASPGSGHMWTEGIFHCFWAYEHYEPMHGILLTNT
jgi:hypothetical protein